ATALAGCGGRADVDVATVPGDFSARQTELAVEAATRVASQPTDTPTVPPTPIPSPTPVPPLPTVTPGPGGESPEATADGTAPTAAPTGTPGSLVGPLATATPDATQGSADTLTIIGCGPNPITVGVTTDEIRQRGAEWQETGEASRAIFDAWDEFFGIYGGLVTYNQVFDNAEVFDGAADFQAVADEQLPVLREIETGCPFYDPVQAVIATTETQVEISALLTCAATQH